MLLRDLLLRLYLVFKIPNDVILKSHVILQWPVTRLRVSGLRAFGFLESTDDQNAVVAFLFPA